MIGHTHKQTEITTLYLEILIYNCQHIYQYKFVYRNGAECKFRGGRQAHGGLP